MLKFCATLHKELLLLLRDRGGLVVLFLMPTVLVFVIALVQDNFLKATGERGIELLLVDNDSGLLGERMEERLEAGGAMTLVRELAGRRLDETTARQMVSDGDFQFCLVIPEGMSETVRTRARALAMEAFEVDTEEQAGTAPESPSFSPAELKILFDPAVQGAFRSAVTNALLRVLLALEVEEKSAMISETFPDQMRAHMARNLGPYTAFMGDVQIPEVRFDWKDEALLDLHELVASGEAAVTPNSVQQNVPAWTLFGMFFIVVPLSGALIRERKEGTMQRLLTIPVSSLTLLSGKIAAYVLVGIFQALLMLLVGKFVLPLFGTPVLDLGNAPFALALLVLSSALAATGYGILVGTLVRSYEQASMFGPVSIVIAAALGGIMVPAYAMPKAMQAMTQFSPLAWGLNGFLEIFVRQGTLLQVWPNILSLLGFFLVTLLCSWATFSRCH